jgi:hypothetical protein
MTRQFNLVASAVCFSFIYIFCCDIAANEKAEELEADRAFLIGLGGNFSGRKAAAAFGNIIFPEFWLQLHTELGFKVYKKGKFSLQVGPELNLLTLIFPIAVMADINAFVKNSYEISSSYPRCNLYIQTPIGYTLINFIPYGGTTVHGFNASIASGLEIDFSKRFGMYFEGGYKYRWHANRELIMLNFGTFNLGLKIRF